LRRHLGMSQRFLLLTVITVAAVALPSFAAAAVVDPLLVVVETAPGAAVDAVEVRQAISGELGTAVRAPRDPAAPDTPNLLIVAVDRAEIRMSLRRGTAGAVWRAVPAPGDRKARLQSIRWLAGNLAHDQVDAIVAPVPAPAPISVAAVEGEPSSRADVPPPAPAPRPRPIHRRQPRTRPAKARGHREASSRRRLLRPPPAAPVPGGQRRSVADRRRRHCCGATSATTPSGPVPASGIWSFSGGLRRAA
jgi:hypothetical protein